MNNKSIFTIVVIILLWATYLIVGEMLQARISTEEKIYSNINALYESNLISANVAFLNLIQLEELTDKNIVDYTLNNQDVKDSYLKLAQQQTVIENLKGYYDNLNSYGFYFMIFITLIFLILHIKL